MYAQRYIIVLTNQTEIIKNKEEIKMKKTYEWTGSRGNKFKLEAEVEFITRSKTTNLDGDVFVLDKKETITNATLTALVDGEVFTICKDINFWVMIDTETEGIE